MYWYGVENINSLAKNNKRMRKVTNTISIKNLISGDARFLKK